MGPIDNPGSQLLTRCCLGQHSSPQVQKMCYIWKLKFTQSWYVRLADGKGPKKAISSTGVKNDQPSENLPPAALEWSSLPVSRKQGVGLMWLEGPDPVWSEKKELSLCFHLLRRLSVVQWRTIFQPGFLCRVLVVSFLWSTGMSSLVSSSLWRWSVSGQAAPSSFVWRVRGSSERLSGSLPTSDWPWPRWRHCPPSSRWPPALAEYFGFLLLALPGDSCPPPASHAFSFPPHCPHPGGRKGEARRGGGGERATSHLRPPWDILLLTLANKLRILQLSWRLHLLTSLPALVGQGMLPCVARVAHGDRVVTDRVRRRRRPEPEPGVTPSCRASISCTFRSKTL